ncbi:hypothetical protein [Chitinophaga defluvii]|uniref:HTH domain-containing protein n=1 Tax=Chitinophaga defluvii TaxID=3163343 RepID=A0ABV2TA63_9BACT
MNVFETIEKINRLHTLIRRKQTGNSRQLAGRLSLSRTVLFELMRELRDMGAPIVYCRVRQCYYYEKEFNLCIQIIMKETEE